MRASRHCLRNLLVLRSARHVLVVLSLLWQIGRCPLMSQFGESVQYFPQFAVGGGYTTFFSVHNPSVEVITVKIDPATGLLAPDGTEQGVNEVFLKGTEPTQQAAAKSSPSQFFKFDQM